MVNCSKRVIKSLPHRSEIDCVDGLVCVMNSFSNMIKAIALALCAIGLLAGSALAQESKTLGDGPIVVRLCPVNCVAVNGHGLKSGGKITVYETKSGWVRVSDFLSRSRLVKSFGNTITRKPALWVSAGQLAGATQVRKPVAQAARPAPSFTRISQLKRIATPTFRPGSTFAQQEQVTAPTQEQAAINTQAETTVAEEETVEAASQTEVVAEPVVVEAETATTSPAGEGTGRLLTWEQLQEKLAQEAEKQKRQSQLSEAEKAALAKEQAELAAKEEERRKAAEAAELERQAKKKKDDETRRAVEVEKARKAEEAARAAEAAEAAEATKAAEAAKAQIAKDATEAARVAAAKQAADAEARKLADEQQAEAARKAAEAMRVEEEKVAAAAAAAAAEEAKTVEPTKELVAAADTPKDEPEPVYKAATAEPISFGSRPKNLTKALMDKRLSKLPGAKSKFRKEVVIALRHYAMGLLNSGECNGIASGGPSAAPGMLYISCSDDPTYLRQFPIKEETW